jgi:hypothetical protein
MQNHRLLSLALALLMSLAVIVGVASARSVEIVISKVSQKMTVRVDGDVEYVWPVSTGAAKYETPTGSFKPFRMEAEHFSKEWDDAPMPHSIFFTGQGHAIHGSFHVKSLGRKASHGCVRLSPENAAILFSLVQTAGMSNTRIMLKGGLFDFGGNRSFAEIGNGIDATVNKRPVKSLFTFQPKPKADKKPVVKAQDAKKPAAKPKKVALKCTTKDGKKTCKKPFSLFAQSAG